VSDVESLQYAQSRNAGWQDLIRDGNGSRALIITGGVAIHAVSIYVVATIMPIVVGDVGGLAFFAWTATLYVAGSLCSAAAVPLLLSRCSVRNAYRVAFGLFLTGSLTCSLAPTMGVLLIGRLLQGLGGGMLPALAYSIIRKIFAPSLHARAITLVGSVWGVAALIGPSIGGVFAQAGAWRAAFWIDVMIGIGFIITSECALPRLVVGESTVRSFPGVRLGLLVAAAISVSSGGLSGQLLTAVLGCGGAAALITVMLRLDGASAPRVLPGGAFDWRLPLGAVSATMGLLILSSSPSTFVPYILRMAHGVAPVIGGYANATYALSWTLVSFLTASAARGGARMAIRIGPLFMCAGMALLAWAVPAGTVPWVIAAHALMGAGIGMAWAHLGALLMEVVPASDREAAGPFITTTQTLAAVFGSAIAGVIANLAGLAHASSPDEMAAAGKWLFGTLIVLPLAGSLMAWHALALTKVRSEELEP
jgi:MFS family permease